MQSNHWYTRDARPAHTVRARDGTERPTTLRDARQLGLVPSVTTVLSVIAKPQLETWKVRQGILAALTLPRAEGETDEAYLDRVLADSRQQAIDAADEGSRIHAAIEDHFAGRLIPAHYVPHAVAARDALNAMFPGVDDWIAEQRFAHPSGYGGCCDLHSPSARVIVDWKGKDGPRDGARGHVELYVVHPGVDQLRAGGVRGSRIGAACECHDASSHFGE